jgi:hypothetical protein
MVTGSFVGLSATVASASTTSVRLSLSSGQWSVQSKAPNAFPATTTTKTGLVGHETTTTGTISGVKLTFPPTPASNGTGKSIVSFLDAGNGTATGTVNYKGTVTISDTLSAVIDVITPLTADCLSTPLDVVFQSTAPYTPTTQDVTVSASNFSIPTFTTTPSGHHSCTGVVASGVDNQFSGSVGNKLTITLHGALELPAPPGTPTTTTLSATPASRQLQGTPVVLKATVKKAGILATGATGTVNFYNGSTLLSTQSVASGTASFTTSTLPAGTRELHAVYSGDSTYAGSTSPTLAYLVEPAPVITLNLPSSVTVGAGPTQFSVKVTNPASGQTWSSLRLRLALTGITQTTTFVGTPTLSYEDSGGNWCSLGISGSEVITGTFKGFGTPPCGTPPTSLSLAAGHSLTLPLEVSYPATDRVGVQGFTATLLTVTATSGSQVPPFTTSSGHPPKASGSFTLNPVTKYTATVTSSSFPTYAIPHGFVLVPKVSVTQPGSPSTLPGPTGTMHFLVTTVTHGSYTYTANLPNTAIVSTSGLSVGSHTLKAEYSGDHVYNSGTYTHTFTVAPQPSGTPFTCTRTASIGSPITVNAAVTASGILPPAAASGSSVPLSDLAVTLTYDNYVPLTSPQTSDVIALTPGGAITAPSATPSVVNDTGTISWTGLSGTTSISGTVGSEVAVGVKTVDMEIQGLATTRLSYDCTAVSAAAPIGTVEVAGTTLAASPASPVVAGTPVTLTATVYPMPTGSSPASHVTFFDGTTNVGTATVSNSGSTAGTASLTVTPAVGTHVFKATWSGTTTVPANTSNSASYTVTAPPPPPAPPPPAPPVTTTTTNTPVTTSGGYHLVASNGSVYSYGNAPFYGSMGGQTLNKPIVGTASTPGDGGYWLVASDGGIFSFGNATFYGSMGGKPLNQPIVGMAATPDGKGYWEVASDGGIFAFGDAPFYGSMGGKALNKPIVGIAATPDGKGYWEVASDGGIFAFGDAQFYGSTGSLTLNKPIVGLAATSNGAGYWLVAADGGVFSFGNAGFHGTVAGTTSASIVSLVPTGDDGGYWETASSGQVFQFGDATSAGTALTQTTAIVAMSD